MIDKFPINHTNSHFAVDEFWRVWMEVGEPHKHGVYESTWMALNAALAAVQTEKL